MRKYIELLQNISKPNFAFHGAKREKIEEILINNAPISAHFYVVDECMRGLSYEEFKLRLVNSLQDSLAFSYNFKENRISGDPAILLAIQNPEVSILGDVGRGPNRLCVRDTLYRKDASFRQIVLENKEVSAFYREYEKKMKGKKVHGNLGRDFFVQKRIVNRVLKEIAKRLSN
jgi:hypothetical protein